jgi:hypothetical protein
MTKTLFKHSLLLLLFLPLFTTTYSQNNKVNNTTQLWSEVNLLGKINKKWKWQADFRNWQQSPYESYSIAEYEKSITGRIAIHYSPSSAIKLSALVSVTDNYQITEVKAREYPEYRGTLQAQHIKVIGLSKISNRIRLEYRDIKDAAGNFEQVFRGRYMLRYQQLLTHIEYDKNSIYSAISDEVFINGGSATTGYKTFDQNRVFLGLGYNITTNIAIETGYLNQYVYHAHDTNFDSNHIWQVTLIFDNITKGSER